MERDKKFVKIKNPAGRVENYDIIAEFPFSSQNKKMSVLVRQKETGKIIYFVKGAEVVLEPIIKSSQKAVLLELCENLAMEGLRTLVFANKLLTEEELVTFMNQYTKAINSIQNRE